MPRTEGFFEFQNWKNVEPKIITQSKNTVEQ